MHEKCGLSMDNGFIFKKINNTGGPHIVLFLRPQGTLLLREPYYSGTDLVQKWQFMTFGFS